MLSIARILRCLFVVMLLPGGTLAETNAWTSPPGADQAFQLSATRKAGNLLHLHFAIAEGNYLYRKSIGVRQNGASLSVHMPEAERKDDPNFGDVEVYLESFDIGVHPVSAGKLSVTYRGCAEAGICYPPATKTIDLATLAVTPASNGTTDGAKTGEPGPIPKVTDDGNTAAALNGSLLAMALAFAGFGVLLAFTPCVFPMIPILSAMLAGSGKSLSPMRGFVLSAAYVVAMAAAYGLVGWVAGISGSNLQLMLQTPWALGLSALVFAGLAFSMFGAFNIALPSILTSRISSRHPSGSVTGAAILGFGSALIVSPCVTPPLAAAILYGIQTGDAFKGAVALFFLGLGMGLPLIVFGTVGPGLLPKSGAWLETVKTVFGFVFLGIAVMLVARLVSATAALALWGAFATVVGVFIGAFDRMDAAARWGRRLAKAAGMVCALYGAILLAGFAGGATDPLQPLAFLSSISPSLSAPVNDQAVTTPRSFDRAFSRLSEEGKPVFVSFTADWCTTCKSNERILAQPDIRKLFAGIPTIITDVTAQDAGERALMKRFNVVGPPTMFFLESDGKELPGSRLVGPITPQELSTRLAKAGT